MGVATFLDNPFVLIATMMHILYMCTLYKTRHYTFTELKKFESCKSNGNFYTQLHFNKALDLGYFIADVFLWLLAEKRRYCHIRLSLFSHATAQFRYTLLHFLSGTACNLTLNDGPSVIKFPSFNAFPAIHDVKCMTWVTPSNK